MPKRKRPEEKPEEQFKKFMQTARKLSVEEDGGALDREFKKLVPAKKEDKQSPPPKPPTESGAK